MLALVSIDANGLAVQLGLLLLRASLVLAAAFGAVLALRGASAAVRAGVWRAAFVALALLPVATWALPRLAMLPAFGVDAAAGARAEGPSVAPVDALPLERGDVGAAASVDAPVRALAAAPLPGLERANDVRRFNVLSGLPRPSVAGALLFVWAFGVALLALRLLRGCMRAAALVRGAAPAAPETLREVRALVAERGAGAFGPRDVARRVERLRVLQSATSEAPFVWDALPWFGRPTLVLHADSAQGAVSAQRVDSAETADSRRGADSVQRAAGEDRAVLLHEAEHLARRDGPLLLLARGVAALLWPTPLVWLALRRLVLETERACDDAVLRGGVRASALAELLVQLCSDGAQRAALPLPSMASSSALEPRVRALLAHGTPRTRSTRANALITAFASIGCAIPLAALAPAEPVARRGQPESAAGAAQDPTTTASQGAGPSAPLPSDAAQSDAPQSSAAQPGAAQAGDSQSPDEVRTALWSRGLAALVAQQDSGTGAWRGDVGYKLNWSWRVTNADVPHLGATGLAVEALVAAGQRREVGPFGVSLSRGVRYLLAMQAESGRFEAHGSRMREHALALRALGVLAQTELLREDLAASLMRGLRFSIAAQNEQGGWRFSPNESEGDIQETIDQLDAARAAVRALTFLSNRAALHGISGARVWPLDSEVRTFLSEVVDEPLRRAEAFIAAHKISEEGHPQIGAFKLQQSPTARITAHTTAAGLLGLALALRGRDVWGNTYERLLELRATQTGDDWARHFEVWEADLLATRALELLGNAGSSDDQALRDQWRAEELRRLTVLEAPGGGWTCDVGPGDAYFTALGCLRLAHSSL